LIINQIADITGIYGISYLILLFNCLIFDLLILKKLKTRYPLISYIPVVLSTAGIVIIFALTIIYGVTKLNEPIDGQNLKVAVIQGSIPQHEKWDFNKINEILNIYKNLTIKAKSYNPQLVIWPETAIPFIYEKINTLPQI